MGEVFVHGQSLADAEAVLHYDKQSTVLYFLSAWRLK